MSVFYANKITLQLSDTTRLIFIDERAPRSAYERTTDGPAVVTGSEEIVISNANARALRDLLVEHIKDDDGPDLVTAARSIVEKPIPH